jgi:alanine racemase
MADLSTTFNKSIEELVESQTQVRYWNSELISSNPSMKKKNSFDAGLNRYGMDFSVHRINKRDNLSDFLIFALLNSIILLLINLKKIIFFLSYGE